ncbi:MAG: peptidylprolyl isomerase [Acidobacteria bacterium]|nr:peptidylprolyl isomerase [Acidobacteriota bacterium]
MRDTKARVWNGSRAVIFYCGVVLWLTGMCVFTVRAQVIEEIIAQVNERVIVLSEYQRSLGNLRQELGQEASGLELEGLFRERSKDILRDLIDQQLLVQKATELGINVESEVVRRLDEIRQQMNLPSMEALEESVAQQGMNYEDLRQNLRDNFWGQRVIGREVGSRVQVTPDEIRTYYEQHKPELERAEGVHIQQILISTEDKSEEELSALRQKAAEVLEKARNSGNFADLARQYSDDATARNGGDAGFFERGSMVPEVEAVAYSLEKNQVSDMIQTRYGFLIIKVLEHTQAGVPPLSEVESRIHERLYLQKIQPALREYLTKLREESYIQIKPGYVDTGLVAQQNSAQNP